jgi:hypothetical protein
MAQSFEVLAMLIPNGGYVQRGDDFEGIDFVNCDPITKEQYQAGFAQYDAWKADQEAAKVVAKEAAEAKLAALGLSVDDLKALGL